MEEPAAPILETCHSCGAYLDSSAEEPFALVHCPSCGASMRVRRLFSHFELQDILGEGGQGRVYKGVDVKLNRPVAVKVMRREFSNDPEFVKRFESEARITASLNHPNIVKVYSFGSDRELLYIEMELVDKASLETLIQHHARVPEVQVLDVGIQIAKGLKAGLEKGLIHRDLKPGNILFSDAHTPKLVDFGLAILIEKQADETGDVWATPHYVSPEKLDGRPEDFRSDMYSLAATLFHALTGRPPFLDETSSMSELRRIKSKPVEISKIAPDLSSPTAFCIDRALSVDPDKRYASYDEFIEHLEFAKNELLAKRSKPEEPQKPRIAKTNSSTVTYAMLALVVGGGLAYYFLSSSDAPVAVPKVPEPVKQPVQTVNQKYMAARDLLIERKLPEAAAQFEALFKDENTLEPYKSGAGIHFALCNLLMNREDVARATFAQINQDIAADSGKPLPDNPEFLRSLATLASEERVIKLAEAAAYNRDSSESLALIILGLKNWELGDLNEGVAFFNEFQKVQLAGDHAWVADYRVFTNAYLDAVGVYRQIAVDLVKAETALNLAVAALNGIPAAKEQLKLTPVLIEKLTALEKEHAPKINARMAAIADELARKKAAEELAENQGMVVLKQKVKQLCDNYRFNEALALIKAFDAKLEKNRTDRDLIAQRVEWLVQFKSQLIKDINAFGYVAPLIKRNGQQLNGGISSASENSIEVKLPPFGTTPVNWSEIAPESLLKIASAYFVRTPAAELNDKRWRTGVFCLFMNKVPEGTPLLEEAAKNNEDYRVHQALFFGKTAEEAPKDTGSEETSTGGQ